MNGRNKSLCGQRLVNIKQHNGMNGRKVKIPKGFSLKN